MKKDKLCCVICGKDITRRMKIYPHGLIGGAYCYDCAEAEKKDEQARKSLDEKFANFQRYNK